MSVLSGSQCDNFVARLEVHVMITNEALRSLEAKARLIANVPVEEDTRNIVYRFNPYTNVVTVVTVIKRPRS